MKAKIKLKIKYEGSITFSKEELFDYNREVFVSAAGINYVLQNLLNNISALNKCINYWDVADYQITI